MSSGPLAALLSLVTSAGLHLGAPASLSRASCDHSRTIRVLFIGNSYTYVNNVPRLVEAIAGSLPGPCIETGMIASGGATLAAHWADDSVTQRIRAGHWTDVVLQDQSTDGEQWWVNGQPRVGTSGAELADYSGRFAGVIKEAKARPILFAHWTDDGAPARDQDALDYAFAGAARATGSVFAPVGEAIKRMRTVIPGVTPYFDDGHHMSAAGSYLEALVLYATLVDHSPLGATRRIEGPAVEFNRGIVFRDSTVTLVDLSDSVATVLQRLAATVYSERHGGIPVVRKPPALTDELPKVASNGDAVSNMNLAGRWSGTSNVMPTPGNKAVAVELVLYPETQGNTVPDSVYLRVPQIVFAGVVTLRVEETNQAVIHGTVIPQSRIGRGGPPVPFTIELRAALHSGVLSGIAVMHQDGTPAMPLPDAVGQDIEVKRD